MGFSRPAFWCAPFCNNSKEAIAGDEVTHGIFCLGSIFATFCNQVNNRVNGTKPTHGRGVGGVQRRDCSRGGRSILSWRVSFHPPKCTLPLSTETSGREKSIILKETNFSGMEGKTVQGCLLFSSPSSQPGNRTANHILQVEVTCRLASGDGPQTRRPQPLFGSLRFH